jgi:exosome complex RNA-binding protein Rrp42 (RNase PH superfamily)
VDIITVKELLGHSTVIVTMRYTHTNLNSKIRAVEKLGGGSYNPATVRKCHKLAANSQSTLELETEEWVSG